MQARRTVDNQSHNLQLLLETLMHLLLPVTVLPVIRYDLQTVIRSGAVRTASMMAFWTRH